jgi:hypothetical protein
MSLYDESLDNSFAADLGRANSISDNSALGDANGLGSLADELAGAFGDGGDYDDDDDDEDEDALSDAGAGEYDISAQLGDDSVLTSSTTPTNDTHSSSPPPSSKPSQKPTRSASHCRNHPSADYSGSDYGDPEDLLSIGISLGLEEKLGQIERLALEHRMLLKHDTPDDSSSSTSQQTDLEGVVPRLMEGLQKLPPQSALETGATRLITAHSALSSHMLHQTRTLRDLSFSLNSYSSSSFSLPPPETADLLISLIDAIPRPTLQPLTELNALHNLTLSLISQLSFLSDSLHMARQSSIAANRKLRVAKEACADWRQELDMVEKAKRWIEDGDWDGRCRRREAAVVCRDVTSGFEDVCRGFEEQLRAQGVTA